MADEGLIIEFWDVGQGDASVLRIAHNRVILIDVGPRNSPIIDWLINYPSIYIESIILTHNDADHAGAMAAIANAARFRIGTVYFLVDRNKKDASFAGLFSRVHAGFKAGEIGALRRLEAPSIIWTNPAGDCRIEVKYPFFENNVLAPNPNITSGIICLSVKGNTKIIWASDSLIESVQRECGGGAPDYMIGPHHGAPADRRSTMVKQWLQFINAGTHLFSVGSNNRYDHP